MTETIAIQKEAARTITGKNVYTGHLISQMKGLRFVEIVICSEKPASKKPASLPTDRPDHLAPASSSSIL